MQSLQSRITISLVSVVVLLVATMTLLVQHEFSDRIIQTETKHAQEIADLTLMTISNEYTALRFHRESLIRERRQTIKNNVAIAFSHISREYRRYINNEISEDEAKQCVIDCFKKLRYSDDVGYFWINDCTQPVPRMIMHPTIPELNGTILDNPEYNTAMGTNKNLFTAFADVCLADGEGYVEYLWPKPSAEGLTEQQPKLSFVKLLPEWNWIVGTGVYIDDIEKECQAHFDEIKSAMFENLAKIKIAQSDYIFIASGDNIMQLHPKLIGANVSLINNPSTDSSLMDDIKSAINNGEDKLKYLWNKPGKSETKLFPKTAFIRYFKPLDWYIVISVYDDELIAPALALRSKTLLISFLFLIVAIFLTWRLGRSIAQPISNLAAAARNIKDEGIINVKPLPIAGTIETQVLGTCLQSMVDTLREEQQELHMMSFLVESAAGPIVMSDFDGKLVYANPAFLDQWGYDNENDVLEKVINDFWISDESIENITESIQENKYTFEEIQAKKKDGTAFPVQLIAAMVKNEQDTAVAIVYSLLDITERKQAEDVIKNYNMALKAEVQVRTEELLEKNSLLENEVSERKKTELELKNTTSQLIQTEKMATIGQLAAGIAHEINTPLGAIGSSCSTMQKQFENIINNVDTELNLYKDNKALINDIIDQILQCDTFPSSRQFRERKAFINKQLTEMKVENPDFAAAILTGIYPTDGHEACLDIFQKDNSTAVLNFIQKIADIFNGIRIINTAVQQSSRVIFALKDYARAEEKQEMIEADIKDTIETAIILYGNKIKHGVELKLDFDDVPAIPCHPHELCQIWTNLISNAIYAMDNNGTLEIKLESDDNNIKITFSDSGHGIPVDVKNNIFEPLYTTKPKGEGTGLGLDIVKRIIERHSGSITCESKVGIGTTFVVTLPHKVNQ